LLPYTFPLVKLEGLEQLDEPFVLDSREMKDERFYLRVSGQLFC